MRHTSAALSAVLIAAAGVRGAGPDEAEFRRRADWLRRDVLDRIAHITDSDSKDANSSRNLTHAAYYLLTFGQDPAHDGERADRLLRRVFAVQDMDPASRRFGDVPWSIDKPAEVDANAIEFTMQPLGPILLRHADRLSPALRELALARARAGVAAIRRHNVRPVYSNIYLMRAQNLLLLGEALHDPAVADEGEAYFENWLRFTRTNGVTEYDSPVYTAVQIDCLNFAYTYTARPAVREKLKTALDYLWADTAANTLKPRGMLAGSHSRCYDFVEGTGCIDRQLYLAGLRDAVPRPTLVNDCGRDIGIVTDGGYRPAPATLALADVPERVVRQTWGDVPGRDKYDYLTPDFAVGSSGGYAGLQDRQIAVDFSGADTLASVSLCVDGWDSPYGTNKFKGKDGHSKARKLRNNSATVQDHGTIVSLLDVAADLGKFDVNGLATNLVLPLDADALLVDGHAVPPQGLTEMTLTTGSVVALRVGHGGVALRVFAADGCDGQSPLVQLKADADGRKANAARLVAYAYRGADGQERRLPAKPVRVGLALRAAACESDADLARLSNELAATRFGQDLAGGVWRVTAALDGHHFEAALDLDHGQAVSRRVDGKDVEVARLTVNGTDFAAALLDPLVLPTTVPDRGPMLP